MTTAASEFRLVADYEMTGDQPQAVDKLVEGLRAGHKHQTLLGVTGRRPRFGRTRSGRGTSSRVGAWRRR